MDYYSLTEQGRKKLFGAKGSADILVTKERLLALLGKEPPVSQGYIGRTQLLNRELVLSESNWNEVFLHVTKAFPTDGDLFLIPIIPRSGRPPQVNEDSDAVRRYYATRARKDGAEAIKGSVVDGPSERGSNTCAQLPDATRKFPLHGTPSKPSLFLGRGQSMLSLKQLLGAQICIDAKPRRVPRAAAITGWPGVGKSTIVSELPYDPEIRAAYPDGVYWMAFGNLKPEDGQSRLVGTLSQWTQGHTGPATISRLTDGLRDELRDRQVLMIVDDCWESNLASRFLQIAGDGSTVIFTSRNENVAEALVPTAADRFYLDDLSPKDAVDLLNHLAPQTIDYPHETASLVQSLGGLPLALVVAGRMLGSRSAPLRGVPEILNELRAGTKLLESAPPPEMIELTKEAKNLSVAALIQSSTNQLTPEERLRFAQLSAFAPKPAFFKVKRAALVWGMDVPDAAVELEKLAGFGLVQAMSDGTVQMHALLNLYGANLLRQMGAHHE